MLNSSCEVLFTCITSGSLDEISRSQLPGENTIVYSKESALIHKQWDLKLLMKMITKKKGKDGWNNKTDSK